MSTQKELIDSEEFENALIEGAEHKKNIDTSYKSQNKENFKAFTEIMFDANENIKKILDTKKAKRTEEDKKCLDDFKKELRLMYNQAQLLLVNEHLEEDQKSRIEKIVDRIIPVIDILRYIGSTKLDEAFQKKGIKIYRSDSLEDKYPILNDDFKRDSLKDIFTCATKLKQDVVDGNEYINSTVYTQKVPVDLQYDKSTNNTGLKTTDFKKLVDAKTKLLMANSDEDKEKAEEKIEHIASEKQFEIARAELVRDKLTKIQ